MGAVHAGEHIIEDREECSDREEGAVTREAFRPAAADIDAPEHRAREKSESDAQEDV